MLAFLQYLEHDKWVQSLQASAEEVLAAREAMLATNQVVISRYTHTEHACIPTKLACVPMVEPDINRLASGKKEPQVV